jgi:hypothetical protein
MAQAFTITQQTFNFTATVVSNLQGISLTTQPLNVSQVRQGYTATIVRNNLGVSSTGTYTVNIAPSPVSVFTASDTDILIGVVEQTIANVAVTNVAENISVSKSDSPITINYNPTLVEQVVVGQAVYTTSSPQFKNITLGNTSTFTFPADDGTSGFALLTDGDGQLYWGPAGGGGGPGYWSLNDDLLTNGFKIKSGTDTVDLKIFGGGKLLDLAPNRSYLGTGTNYLEINNGIDLNAGNTYRLFSNPNGAGLLSTYGGVRFGTGFGNVDFANFNGPGEGHLIITGAKTELRSAEYLPQEFPLFNEWPRVLMEAKELKLFGKTITIGYDSNINFSGPITAESVNVTALSGPSGAVLAPNGIRFSDGSVLNTALIGTATQFFTSTQLTSDLFQNGFNIWSNNGRIRAGGASLVVYSSTFTEGIHQEGLIVDAALGAGFNINGYRAELNVPNALGEIVLNAPKVYLGGDLRFPDGSIQTTAIPSTSSVTTIFASTGISISSSTGAVTITNSGVRKLIAANNSIKVTDNPQQIITSGLNTQTGDVYIGIGTLPIITGYAIDIDQTTWENATIIAVNSATIANNIRAGDNITVTRNGGQVTISANTASLINNLSGDLRTNGFKIDGGSNRLDIEAGKFSPFGTTQTSRISMPFNSAMRITSDFGIVLDTPDFFPIQILSPLTVLHRDGSSRISTDAQGQTTLNDTRIAITGTNRVVINRSDFRSDYINLASTSSSASLYLGPTKAIITATEIVLATTATVKVGSSIYNSQLAVQDIVNYNGTGPVTVSKGIQFPDTTVQRTAYIGGLDFGAITAPATNLEQFLLQLQSVDFGTFTTPSTYAFDAGVIE